MQKKGLSHERAAAPFFNPEFRKRTAREGHG